MPDTYLRDYFPTAAALLDLWRVPHSGRYLRFAFYALRRVQTRIGVNVLDSPG